MKNTLTILLLIITSYCFSQEFDTDKYLNGTWCQKGNQECFDLISQDGLLMFAIPDGGYIAGVEILKYDDINKKIFWRIFGTAKETQYFEILKKNKVNHFDGVKTKALYRINKKE